MRNQDHRSNRKRIGDYISKIMNLTRPIIMSKLREKMTLKMHYRSAVALIHHKTTLTCRRFMNKFISCLMLKNKLRERRRRRPVFFKKSTIKTI